MWVNTSYIISPFCYIKNIPYRITSYQLSFSHPINLLIHHINPLLTPFNLSPPLHPHLPSLTPHLPPPHPPSCPLSPPLTPPPSPPRCPLSPPPRCLLGLHLSEWFPPPPPLITPFSHYYPPPPLPPSTPTLQVCIYPSGSLTALRALATPTLAAASGTGSTAVSANTGASASAGGGSHWGLPAVEIFVPYQDVPSILANYVSGNCTHEIHFGYLIPAPSIYLDVHPSVLFDYANIASLYQYLQGAVLLERVNNATTTSDGTLPPPSGPVEVMLPNADVSYLRYQRQIHISFQGDGHTLLTHPINKSFRTPFQLPFTHSIKNILSPHLPPSLPLFSLSPSSHTSSSPPPSIPPHHPSLS